MNRREFVQGIGCAALGVRAKGSGMPPKTHIVTLSFDDGFRRSFYRTAEIYEQFGLRACLNVIAMGHEAGFGPKVDGRPDPGITGSVLGSFEDWNRLKKRGHEVMAHSYNHANLTQMPLEEARADIARCAEHFERHLEGFKASRSVYNFAYNASNPDLDAYALTRFLVVRTGGRSPVNPVPRVSRPVRIGCISHGPDCCDDVVEDTLNRFLDSEGGWYVFNTHGLDGEGWGPMTSRFLTALLKRLKRLDHVEVLPAGEVVLRLPPPK